MPDRLYKQKKFLDENSDIALVGSNAILIDEDSKGVGRAKYPTLHEDKVRRIEKFQPIFPHSSFFFKKNVILNEGGYNEYYTKSQDCDLYLRLCEKNLIAGFDDYLIKLRYTPFSLSYESDFLQLKLGLLRLLIDIRCL